MLLFPTIELSLRQTREYRGGEAAASPPIYSLGKLQKMCCAVSDEYSMSYAVTWDCCIVRYMGPLHSTWQASSRRRQRSLDVSTCDLLLNRNWSFHGAVGRRLAVGRFRGQVCQSGMHYRTVWEIQSWLWTFSGVIGRLTSSRYIRCIACPAH